MPTDSPAPTSRRSSTSSAASSSSSSLDSDLAQLTLDPKTQALLDSFYQSEADRESKLQELKRSAGGGNGDEDGSREDAAEGAVDGGEIEPISVDTFRELFKEDWQISQFWYSTPFATSLSAYISSCLPSPTSPVAFLCCPTGFVAFQHQHAQNRERRRQTKLWEFDERFGLLRKENFVKYDLNNPEEFPEEWKGSVELAVVDPPFMNEITNLNLAKTLKALLHPTRGRLILLTSTSVEHHFENVYGEPPLGPLKRVEELVVRHEGGLSNGYGVWSSFEVQQ
ncbi:EEF1A lysine methyltransferase 1, partial [Phenoliferia sp. Uapishka_3]